MKKDFAKYSALAAAALVSMGILTACGNAPKPAENSEKVETTDKQPNEQTKGEKAETPAKETENNQ